MNFFKLNRIILCFLATVTLVFFITSCSQEEFTQNEPLDINELALRVASSSNFLAFANLIDESMIDSEAETTNESQLFYYKTELLNEFSEFKSASDETIEEVLFLAFDIYDEMYTDANDVQLRGKCWSNFKKCQRYVILNYASGSQARKQAMERCRAEQRRCCPPYC